MFAAPELHHFPTDDGNLVHRAAGTGPPLVLLHGGFLDHRMWDDQVPAFAATHRVIAPDTRGHGASANATRPFRQTDDLAALLRHLDTGPAVLVGVSMGAGIAVDTALEHPDLVRALVVTGAGTSEPDFRDPWTTAVLADWERALAAGDVEGWLAAFLRFVPGPHRRMADVDPEVVRRQREMALATITKHTAGEPDHRVPVQDTWARVAKIDVPVLAVHGGLDSDDHHRMADRLVRSVPGARAVTVDGAAHYPGMERPDVYNALVSEFLRTL
ncbi:Pimeloyl-[acyl-carrier protein] methyl ester esterase [Streptomyces sp. enrichment culture]|uniref:alpha/beta fold hydrolase n=1 Tax=Streptomyces sp. enrichment culture TaxID=1795815 RepID=UPI003F55F6AC